MQNGEYDDSYRDYSNLRALKGLIETLNQNQTITCLKLIGCNLNDESVSALIQLSYIKELILDRNNIDKGALQFINSSFSQVSLNENAISPRTKEQLSSNSTTIICERGGFTHPYLFDSNGVGSPSGKR